MSADLPRTALAAGKQLNTNFMDAARDFDINIGDRESKPEDCSLSPRRSS